MTFNQAQIITKTLTVDVMDQPIIEPPIDGGQNGGPDVIPPQPETFLQKVWRFILGLIGLDSGLNTNSSTINEKPIEFGFIRTAYYCASGTPSERSIKFHINQ